jgi:predicted O-methyltransferase YrrM
LFGDVRIVPYPACGELFSSLAYAPDPRVTPAIGEENYYQLYYAVSAALRPRSYLEIGTLFGYSTIAVAKGSERLETIVSCDLQSYATPYDAPSQQVAEANLRASGYANQACFIAADSRQLAAYLGDQQFDLILIDADHTYDGCRADIELAFNFLAPRGVVMIDDQDVPDVFAATRDALHMLGVAETCFIPTKHGLVLGRL